MTEQQLQLVDVPAVPLLTDRQQTAYQAIVAAGYQGLDPAELGAVDHHRQGKHSADDRCQWCGQAGKQIGKELRAKGLVKQRRRRHIGGDPYSVWTVAGKLSNPDLDADMPVGRESGSGVPYNEFPEGF